MKSNRKTLRELVASLLAVFLVLSVLPVSGLAQTETGQITVKASDPQGAVIPAATVTVKSVERSQTLTSTTNDEGVATITNLQPGLYEIVVSASGFANYTQRAQITAGAKLSIDASLAASGAGVVVDVVAGEGGVEVNTQTQELSNVVSAQQVTELPTLTRNPYALVAISGNVSDADPSGRGTGFAINGQRAASTNILLDGGENVDTFTATVGQSVPLDSVQEFRIITSNFSAEYGRATGGIVNVTTRSGTNDFHGTLFLFNRVDKLASNDFDDNAQGLEKSHFVRNQFGYSVGGRIIRDKLFFFSSTEFIRVRSSANVTNWVPTPQFLNAVNARTRSAIGAFGTVSPLGRTLTRSQVSTLLNLGTGAFNDLPAGLPVFGEVQYQVPADVGAGAPQNSYQTVGRIDWNASDKTQIYGRFAIEDQLFFDGSNASSPFVGFNTGAETLNQNYLIN
ncbi:MAG TPA: carboxypeptidase regulatory-like domain-containing protein, partial [Blastocatellia bacterium]